MSNKKKGSNVAGSGVNDDSPCDLIVGKINRKGFTIEAKSSRKDRIYISKMQIEDFILFSKMINLNPIIALRFNREGWLFLNPKELVDSGKNWVISLKKAKEKGLRFSQFFEK
ncbi:hypothetical protein CXT76_02160 [Candidatus Parvarchaeota archaeon]|nr:MAG: hypothetical protein CXT76_02160 [Candidatus Parvarchaeota archaeon]